MREDNNVEYKEKLILKGIYQNKGFAEGCFSNILPEYFNEPSAKLIFEHQKKNYEEHGNLLEPDAFIDDNRKFFNDAIALDFNVKERQRELVSKANEYMRIKKRQNLIMRKVDVVENVNHNAYEEITELELETISFNISGADDFKYFINGTEWNQLEFGEIEYYLYPIISETSITLVVGDRGIGKTIFLMCLCDAVAKGQDFGIWENRLGANKVLYVDGELPQKLNQRNTMQININENFINYCRSYVYENTEDGNLVLTNPGFRDYLMEFIKMQGIKLVVFDNLSMLAPGINENDKKDYDDINQYFLSLRSIGVSVIVVHHTGKSGDQRGTKSREDNVDTIIYLRYPHGYKQEDGARFNLSFSKFRGVVDDRELIRTRELWYQKNRQNQNQYEWCFDSRLDLTQDPQFLMDVAIEKLKYDELKDKYGVSKGTLTSKTKKLEEKGLPFR